MKCKKMLFIQYLCRVANDSAVNCLNYFDLYFISNHNLFWSQ